MKWVMGECLPGTGSDEAPGRNGGAKNRVAKFEMECPQSLRGRTCGQSASPNGTSFRVRFVSDSLLMIQANLIRRIKEPMAMASPTTS